MSFKCSDCGEPLYGEVKCPRCGSGNKKIEITLRIPAPTLGLKIKSAERDERGKSITEARIRVQGKTQTKMTVDRSKRLRGISETDVFHEVVKNGKTVHGPHLEPKGKRKIARH
jgi:uncharacterized Zn finger protein (UPF0148 family)